jgi:hypothetical protein
MQSAYLSLAVVSDAEAERIFLALSDAGEVFIPMIVPRFPDTPRRTQQAIVYRSEISNN